MCEYYFISAHCLRNRSKSTQPQNCCMSIYHGRADHIHRMPIGQNNHLVWLDFIFIVHQLLTFTQMQCTIRNKVRRSQQQWENFCSHQQWLYTVYTKPKSNTLNLIRFVTRFASFGFPFIWMAPTHVGFFFSLAKHSPVAICGRCTQDTFFSVNV